MISSENPQSTPTSKPERKSYWRKFTVGFIFAAIFLLVLAPEMAMFTFLLDAAVIDLIIIFTGIQCQMYWSYFTTMLYSGFTWAKNCCRRK